VHSNVEPASLDVKPKLTLAAEGSDGLAVIVVCGGVVSTVQVYEAGAASVFPAGSVARTSNV
jgi:hypothetical protein